MKKISILGTVGIPASYGGFETLAENLVRNHHEQEQQGELTVYCSSKSYPVKNIAGEIVRAEEAIEAARRVVIDITLQDIIKGKSYNIDLVSKFYLTAWHLFKARIFPFDEARRLARSLTRVEPDEPSYWVGSGVFYLEGGNVEKAISCFQEGIKLDPNNKTLLIELELAQQKAEDIQKSLKNI